MNAFQLALFDLDSNPKTANPYVIKTQRINLTGVKINNKNKPLPMHK